MPDTLPGLAHRVRTLEGGLDRLTNRVDAHADLREQVAVLRTKFEAFSGHVLEKLDSIEEHQATEDTKREQGEKRTTRLLVGLMVTLTGSAITFAVTTLVVFGGPG